MKRRIVQSNIDRIDWTRRPDHPFHRITREEWEARSQSVIDPNEHHYPDDEGDQDLDGRP